nr:serine/threonine-protein kinase DCLK2-like isoform X2 [Oncorhynchus gorbuscha]
MVVTEPIFTVCGTPTYVAPQILSETGYGLPVDLWALGVIVHILLCGFPPFRRRDRDQEELFQMIREGHLTFLAPYWDHISDAAQGLVKALLQVNPTERLTAVQTLKHPWIQTTTDQNRPVPTSTESIPYRPVPTSTESIPYRPVPTSTESIPYRPVPTSIESIPYRPVPTSTESIPYRPVPTSTESIPYRPVPTSTESIPYRPVPTSTESIPYRPVPTSTESIPYRPVPTSTNQ